MRIPTVADLLRELIAGRLHVTLFTLEADAHGARSAVIHLHRRDPAPVIDTPNEGTPAR